MLLKTIKNSWLEVLIVGFSAVVTYYLSGVFSSSVIAASLVGLLGALIGNRFNRFDFALAIYCGTFIGMSSNLILVNLIFVLLAEIVSGLIFIFAKNILKVWVVS